MTGTIQRNIIVDTRPLNKVFRLKTDLVVIVVAIFCHFNV